MSVLSMSRSDLSSLQEAKLDPHDENVIFPKGPFLTFRDQEGVDWLAFDGVDGNSYKLKTGAELAEALLEKLSETELSIHGLTRTQLLELPTKSIDEHQAELLGNDAIQLGGNILMIDNKGGCWRFAAKAGDWYRYPDEAWSSHARLVINSDGTMAE